MKTLERQSWSGWLTAVGSWSGEREQRVTNNAQQWEKDLEIMDIKPY